MTYKWVHLLIFLFAFVGLTPVLGTYMAKIFTGQRCFAVRTFGWLENFCYRIGHVNPKEEMSWIDYAKALLLFNVFGLITLFLLVLAQGYLPLNPQNFPGVSLDLAFNIAVSFVTNTNWQSYAGETTLSHFSQMLGLTSQNFLSAATGMAVFLTLTRGFIRKTANTVGNFWVDLVRMVVYILLPISIILAIVLVSQGVIQTFSPNVEISTLENSQQIIPLGPVASQVAIKQLGSNGGGFFHTNSAHPFENPTGLSNFLEMLAIMLIPSSIVYTYGLLINSTKHAWLIFIAMLFFWIIGVILSIYFEQLPNPILDNIYPNLEGKEIRFGVASSIRWTISTAATSNGSVNAMLTSLSPLVGGIAMFYIMLGELVFGGIGVGMCNVIMLTLLSIFLSGLMVGRTPEYLGKKIEKREMQLVVMAVLYPAALILAGAGITSILPTTFESLTNKGPHGLSEIIYAFVSSARNNGSAFSGLQANTPYYNIFLGVIIFLGRCAIIFPSLALAGSMARKKIIPPSLGTFSTTSIMFLILLIFSIVFVGALTFFPALSLGPFAEHLLMREGRSF